MRKESIAVLLNFSTISFIALNLLILLRSTFMHCLIIYYCTRFSADFLFNVVVGWWLGFGDVLSIVFDSGGVCFVALNPL